MKIKHKNFVKGSGMLVFSTILSAGVTVPFVLINKYSTNHFKNNNRFTTNEAQLSTLLLKDKQKVLNESTVKRSLKMVLKLYRGGVFDFSKTLILNSKKSVNYKEFVEYIEKANISQLKFLVKEFTKIVFQKKIAIKFSQYISISYKLKNNNPLSAQDVVQIKTLLNLEGVDNLYKDFSFFTTFDRKFEVSMSKILNSEQFYNFITFVDKNNKEYSPQETKNLINLINTESDLKQFLEKGPQEPIFSLNLDDKYLINFKDIKPQKFVPTFNQAQTQGSSVKNVQVNYEDFDPIFGYNQSLYAYKSFIENCPWNNFISPMLIEKIREINSEAKWDWGIGTRYYNNVFPYIENDEQKNSKIYTKLQTLDNILDYEPSKIQKQIIPLNEQRFFENKLKSSQTGDYGISFMTAPDSFKENGTKDWYPHYKSAYPTMWQYMKNMVYWGYGLTLPTPEDVSTAHKNGVRALGTLFHDEPSSMTLKLMSMTEDDEDIFIENLIQIMKDSGTDGLFWNAELASWWSSGVTFPTFYKYREFLHKLDLRFKQENLMFWQYSNYNVEVPRDYDDQMAWIMSNSNEAINLGYDKYKLFESSTGTIMNRAGVPGDATFSVNHFTPELDLYDNEFGIGARKQIFLGFVDKVFNEQVLKERLLFANKHKDYTLQVLQYDYAPQTRNFIDNEWKIMQSLKSQNLSELSNVDLEHYYGDYALFANATHMSPEYEWDIPLFISRESEIKSRKIEDVADDFHDYKGNDPYIGTGGGRGQLNNRPYLEWYWGVNGQDPRSSTGAMSDYFQERSTVGFNSSFSSSFEFGYGHFFNENGHNIINHDWANIGAQDILPTYRYLIDKYDSSGKLLNNFQDIISADANSHSNHMMVRDVEAHIVEDVDSIYGNNILTYSGNLEQGDSIVNKLYVTNLNKDKEFSIIVKDSGFETSLALWRNKKNNAEFIKPSSEQQLSNGYKKLIFNVQASDSNLITSFGLKIENLSSTFFDLSKIKIDGISFNDSISKTHDFANIQATTQNQETHGVNVSFNDSAFDENTRYMIYDENDNFITFSTTPSFYLEKGGKYKIKVHDPLGNILIGEKEINISIAIGWDNV